MAAETDIATTAAAEAGGHGATTEAAHSAGLPQFEFQHWGGQIAYFLVLFVVLYLLMAKVFAPRIRRVFDERAATISGALASARAVQLQADEQAEVARRALAQAREQAQKTAQAAKTQADAETRARQADLEAELDARQAEAEVRIRAARESAMQQLATVATETAEAIVEKLTGAPAPRDAIASAVKLQG